MTNAPATLLQQLESRKQTAKQQFEKKHAFAKKWLAQKGLDLEQIRQHSARLLTGATLGTTMLLSAPAVTYIGTSSPPVFINQTLDQVLAHMKQLPQKGGSSEQEIQITQDIKQQYGVEAVFEMDKQRLPYYRGRIGLEQHLLRYAGDTTSQHNAYQEAGMAPARGAFGYFFEEGKSQDLAVQQEKYYVVLQTFLIPEWNAEWSTLKEWYKFRKFLVINPENGQAVVAVLGDSGPGVSTGKVFGGSPEVMAGLGFYPKRTSGEVIFLFLDDPGNTIPLGPISLKGGTI